jgi:hypothetical protein
VASKERCSGLLKNLIFCHEVSQTNYATERLLSRNPSTTHSVARNETRRDRTSLVERFELGVLRAVDLAHSTSTDGCKDLIGPQTTSGSQGHRVLADSISLGIVHSGHVLRRNDLDTTHFRGEGVSGQSDLATIVRRFLNIW